MKYSINKQVKEKRINYTLIFWISFILMLLFLDTGLFGGANTAVLFLLINIGVHPVLLYSKGQMKTAFVLYALYLFVVTVSHFSNNFDPTNSLLYFCELIIIFTSCDTALRFADFNKLFIYIRNTGLFFFILGIIEAIVKTPFLCDMLGKSAMFDPSGYRINLFLGHPIVCGVLLLTCWICLIVNPYKKIISNIIANTLGIAAIILTRSRSVWLAFAIVLLLILVKKTNWKKHRMRIKTLETFALVVIIILVINAVSNFRILSQIFNYISSRIIGSLYAGQGQGNIIRVDTVLNSINYWRNGNILKFLFGMGKNYDKYFMQMFPVVKWGRAWTAAIDNQYFTTIHEAGLIGLVFTISIPVMALVRFIRSNKNNIEAMVSNLVIISIFISNYFYEGLNYMSILTILAISIIISDRDIKINKVRMNIK